MTHRIRSFPTRTGRHTRAASLLSLQTEGYEQLESIESGSAWPWLTRGVFVKMIGRMAKRAGRRSHTTEEKLKASKEKPVFQARFRILHDGEIVLGPGKAELLGAVQETASISAAAKRMKLSYMRAWEMIRTMNKAFRGPLVLTARGGRDRGGAALTPLGLEVLSLYRKMEQSSRAAASREWKQLVRLLD